MTASHRLRGSDTVYAAVALRVGSTLVTFDPEQQKPLEDVVSTYQPAEILDNLE